MARLAQLARPEAYRACDWDLKRDAPGRARWLAHFRQQLEPLLARIREQYPAAEPGRLARFRDDFLQVLDALARRPQRYPRIDVLLIDELRHDLLARYGLADPYRDLKRRENQAALAELPGLLAELDAAPPPARIELLAAGLLAGNLFDTGAPAAMERYRNRGLGFRQLRAALPARPWFIDDLDRWRRRWLEAPPYHHALIFADNAGPDICLGALPLARWMLQAGTRVTLAANSHPALNDVTAPELDELLVRAAELDSMLAAALADRRLSVVPTGARAPLLDLAALTRQCVSRTAAADLVILHGMGRAVESNFRARFRCAALWVAVLKDQAVAGRVGGQLFDCLFRFRQAGRGAGQAPGRAARAGRRQGRRVPAPICGPRTARLRRRRARGQMEFARIGELTAGGRGGM